jgi:Sulfotransferase family
MILGAHPEILALSEIAFFDRWIQLNDLCNCGVPVRSCPLWSKVIDRLSAKRDFSPTDFANQFAIDLSSIFDRTLPPQRLAHLLSILAVRTFPKPIWLQMGRLSAWSALLERTRNAVEFYDTACEVSGRSILVDSSKSIYRSLHIHFMRPCEVLAVYLTRDGRAVMNSLMKTGYSAREAARRWWRANLYTKWMLGRIPPERQIHLAYEELCRAPQETLRKLCRFIGIQYVPSMFASPAEPYHLIGGNDLRLKPELSLVEDRSWQTGLSRDSLDLFERLSGRLNRKLLKQRSYS